MDAWEFVSRSEWPIVVGGAIWLLRRSLQDMINRVNPTRVDAFGFKAEFERTLEKVEILAPPSEQKKPPSLAMDDKILGSTETISASPEAVILDSWRRLENTVRQKLQPSKMGNFRLPLAASELKDELKLTDDEIAAYASLHKLRNQVAHADAQVSRADALRFKDATERLLYQFEA